jgi:toxin ParE1/3/4
MLVEGPYLILYETHPDTDDGPIETVESCASSMGGAI